MLEEVVDILDFEREPINTAERTERISGKTTQELFPYYGATGQVGWIDSYRTEGMRVLLGEDGAPFLDPGKDKAYLVSGRFWVNNHAHVLRGASDWVDNRFLCYQLNTVDYQPFVSGSTRLKLTNSAMKRIPLLIAPQHEQTRIVEKLEELLSDLDAGVAELKAAQKKLAQYRQALLKAAVEGALTAEWRTARTGEQETGAQLLARILSERRRRWEEKQLAKFKQQGKTPPKGWRDKYPEPVQPDTTDLPALPEGWVWAAMDSLIADGPQNGLYLHAKHYGSGHPILRIDDFQVDWLRPRDELNLVDASPETHTTYALRFGDLLINRVNSMTHLGKSLVAGESLCDVLFESNMMRAQLSAAVDSNYVGLYLGAEIGRKRLIRQAKWAVNQASINQQDVKRTPIPVPPADEQRMIVEMVSSLLAAAEAQIKANEHALTQSAAQRKNLLKAAFSGQLVPQDPDDEPASALLKRIRVERATAAKQTGSRKTRNARQAQ